MANDASKSLYRFIKTLMAQPKAEHIRLSQAFADDDVVRRKYILSRACDHLGKDKFEPAPLLNKKLLDIGCGTSTIPGELVLRGALVTALDINANTLERARKEASARGMDVIYIHSTPEQFAQEHPEKYDIILCLDVIEEIANAATFAAAIQALLAEDGLMIITGRSNNISAKLIYRAMRQLTPNSPYKRRLKQLEALFAPYGITLKHSTGLSFDLKTREWFKTEKSRLRYMAAFSRRT